MKIIATTLTLATLTLAGCSSGGGLAAPELVVGAPAVAEAAVVPEPEISAAVAPSPEPTPSPTPAPTPEPTPKPERSKLPDSVLEGIYVDLLRENYPAEYGPVSDKSLIGLGRSACGALERGVSLNRLLRAGGKSGVSPGATGAAIGGAIVAFCPEFKYLIPD